MAKHRQRPGRLKNLLLNISEYLALCATFMCHLSRLKRGKLDEKAEKGILTGYEEAKGYRIYNLGEKKNCDT